MSIYGSKIHIVFNWSALPTLLNILPMSLRVPTHMYVCIGSVYDEDDFTPQKFQILLVNAS